MSKSLLGQKDEVRQSKLCILHFMLVNRAKISPALFVNELQTGSLLQRLFARGVSESREQIKMIMMKTFQD